MPQEDYQLWAETAASAIDALLSEIDELKELAWVPSGTGIDEAVLDHARRVLAAYEDIQAGRDWPRHTL